MGLQIFLAKERQKFSAAHMTILGKDRKERLHGHNYQVELRVAYPETSTWVPFSVFKEALHRRCEEWDEYLLLPGEAPEFQSEVRGDSLEFQLCGKKYSVPKEEVRILPLKNITSESLAELLCKKLKEDLKSISLSSLEITLYESPGQGATFSI